MGLFHRSGKATVLAIGTIWMIALCIPVSAGPVSNNGLTINSETPKCRSVRDIPTSKQCAFAKQYCADQDDGFLSYVDFYYCRVSAVQPLGLLTLILWMVFLFSSLGIVAGDFLAVNLNSIAQNLQISDTLAGVTFLALGNGAPDIFSTIAAMGDSSNNLAFGELIGAAAFITSVVSGSMALIRPFDVVKIPFVRDALFLLATIFFLIYILIDGHLRLWHCVALLLIYTVYIFVVVGWHWWQARRRGMMAPNATTIYNTEQRRPGTAGEDEPLIPQDQAQSGPRGTSSVRRRSYNRDYTTLTPSRNNSASAIPMVSDSKEKSRTFPRRALQVLIPTYSKRGRFSLLHLIAYIIMLPMTIALKITTPRVEEEEDTPSGGVKIDETDDQDDNSSDSISTGWDRWLTVIHCFTAPQFIMWLIARQLSKSPSAMLWPCLICLGASALLAALVILASPSNCRPRWWRILSLPGFIVSIAWISALADEIVSVLKILGIVCDIPDAIMGITAFAIGNSVDDWAANISVARRKRPVMALSACFGGPLLNILLGISISGILAFVRAAGSQQKLSAIDLHPNRSLFFVSGSVILNISLLLVLMLWTRWRMERLVGYILSGLWVICTVINVVLELTR